MSAKPDQPHTADLRRATTARSADTRGLTTADRLNRILRFTSRDYESGRYRRMLYRFLTDNIPLVNACIWTWVRLAAAPGAFHVLGDPADPVRKQAEHRLQRLTDRLYTNPLGGRVGLDTLLPDLFMSLYRDGIFGGFVTIAADSSGVDQFIPIDPINLYTEGDAPSQRLVLELENGKLSLDRPDFYYIPFGSSISEPFGGSILRAIPFVAYIEQQLVDDMRRTSHNSGFHRLHVKITPPERLAGESDTAYTDRINDYFDHTVGMIRKLDIDENPVTWDNVLIEHVGPDKAREVTNSWFMTHRAIIEDICAGTHLAPYLLGYSYGATTTWSAFKFDLVMRQVRSVQSRAAAFLEWLGKIDLALAGIDTDLRFEFDNTFAYQAKDNLAVETGRVDNIIKLLDSGLIDQQTARDKLGSLI
ncbi:hypothetical protein GF377_04290 [candidate division GN15 bacterium]|nr:hypothetical protein [candidate division GN15 bacterium]